jgi:hypothetical protein
MTALGLAAPRERERAVTAGFCCRSGAWKMAWRPCLGEFGGRIEKEKGRLKRGIDLEQSCSLARRGDGGCRRPGRLGAWCAAAWAWVTATWVATCARGREERRQ